MGRKESRTEPQIKVHELADALRAEPLVQACVETTVLWLRTMLEDPQQLELVFPGVSFAAPDKFGYTAASMEGRLLAFLSAERIQIGLDEPEIRETDLWAKNFSRDLLPAQISSADGIATGLRALYLLGQYAGRTFGEESSEGNSLPLAAAFVRILALGRLLLPIAIASSSGHPNPVAAEWSRKFIQLAEQLDTCNIVFVELS